MGVIKKNNFIPSIDTNNIKDKSNANNFYIIFILIIGIFYIIYRIYQYYARKYLDVLNINY